MTKYSQESLDFNLNRARIYSGPAHSRSITESCKNICQKCIFLLDLHFFFSLCSSALHTLLVGPFEIYFDNHSSLLICKGFLNIDKKTMQEDDTLIFRAYKACYWTCLILWELILGRYSTIIYNHKLMLLFKSIYLSPSLRVWMNGPCDRWISTGRERGNFFYQLEGSTIPWKLEVKHMKESDYGSHGMGHDGLWRQASPIWKFGLDQVQFVWFSRQCKCLFCWCIFLGINVKDLIKEKWKGQTFLEPFLWNNDLLASSH